MQKFQSQHNVNCICSLALSHDSLVKGFGIMRSSDFKLRVTKLNYIYTHTINVKYNLWGQAVMDQSRDQSITAVYIVTNHRGI